MPPSLSGAPELRHLPEPNYCLYTEELPEQMLWPASEVASNNFKSHWDPHLRYDLRTYHKFVKRLHDIG